MAAGPFLVIHRAIASLWATNEPSVNPMAWVTLDSGRLPVYSSINVFLELAAMVLGADEGLREPVLAFETTLKDDRLDLSRCLFCTDSMDACSDRPGGREHAPRPCSTPARPLPPPGQSSQWAAAPSAVVPLSTTPRSTTAVGRWLPSTGTFWIVIGHACQSLPSAFRRSLAAASLGSVREGAGNEPSPPEDGVLAGLSRSRAGCSGPGRLFVPDERRSPTPRSR